MAIVISFLNFKGGVGKTTSTVNTAKALNLMGKKVLVIDADPQGNASGMMGYSAVNDTDIPTLHDAMLGNATLNDCCCVEGDDETSFDYIPSTLDLSDCEQQLISTIGRETILTGLIDEIKDDYDFILIDCPPSKGMLTQNAMCASNYVIVPISGEKFGIQGLGNISKEVLLFKKRMNPNIEILGYVLCNYDGRYKTHASAYAEMKEYFPDTFFRTVIHTDGSIKSSQSENQNIFVYKKNSVGAKNYMTFAHEMINRINKK